MRILELAGFPHQNPVIPRPAQGRRILLVALALSLCLPWRARAQTPAVLTSLGATAPVPSPNDLSQFLTTGQQDKPDSLNYYTDNAIGHPAIGEPGQTFTTGNAVGGYILSSIAFKTGGGTSSGLTTPQDYLLHVFSVNGATATLMQTFGTNSFVFADGDWLRWSGFSISLAANTTYAYSFGRTSSGTGWDELFDASVNPYPGGEIGLFPPAGGAITFGASHGFDGVFDLGISPVNSLAAAPPVISPTNNPIYAGTQVTLTEIATGQGTIHYQWQTDGATGGSRTNIPGATLTNLLVNTSNLLAGAYKYDVVVSNSAGFATSAVAVVNIAAASVPPVATGVLADNPIGYWRLNETADPSSGSLVAADLTQNFNGVYGSAAADGIAGPTLATGFAGFENSNTAARFTNGVLNSYVILPALNLNASTVTFTTWVYPIGVPANYAGIIFCRNGGDASGFCWTDNGQIGYTWNQNDQNTWAWMSGLVPPAGQWSFIALVVSPTNAVAYLCNSNGQASATNAIAHSAEAFSGPTHIGDDAADGAGGRTFNGVMDEVAIFNTSLNQSQILNLYFNGAGGAPKTSIPLASPANTVFAGTTVTLTASVVGQSPFQYQWQTNGVNIAGATASALVLPNTTVAMSGSYDVIVSNGSGTNKSPALVLAVNPAGAPIFTHQPTPVSVTNYVGSLVTFTAGVDGSPPLHLQWRLNGSDIPSATASVLTLASLQLAEAGTYTLVASNAFGVTNSSPVSLTVLPIPNAGVLNMLTYHNDNTRQGANTNEFLLTPANVNATTFGKLFTYTVDGHIYAEPLYVSGLNIPGQGTHNTVFVATEHDSVYAFDADSNAGANGGLLWTTNLGISAVMPNNDFGNRYGPYHDLVPEMGITSTPVIDLASGTIYLDVFTHEGSSYYHRIHALNITNGAELPFSPKLVTASFPGKGVSSSGGVINFVADLHLQRPALTLAGGMLYVAYSSYADTDPYHGWVMGFNATNLQLTANNVFNTTPNATVAVFGANAGEGGIWMGGNGLSVDASNNLYFEVGNGSFTANTNGGDYGDSFMKLSTTNGLAVADYFTPYNQASLSAGDTDLGSGGPLLLPDSVGSVAHPHLMVGCGKEGKIYLVDRDHMGHYNSTTDTGLVVQEIGGAVGGTWSSPAYFNHLIYYQGNGDVMRAFAITNGVITTTPFSRSSTSFGFPGATPAISANGANNGIAWIIQADAYTTGGPSILHAYNATNLQQELYNTSQNLARDNPGGAVKMTVPTVINGKVYMGAEYALSVYGNSIFMAAPTITPLGGNFTNSVTVTLADATPNASIYYTLDGTTPTTNSILYTGPFVLTTSASVIAVATEPGAVNSGVTSAGFIDSAAVGDGTGLQGSYWANLTAAAFTNSSFATPANLVRTDPAINFNWSSSPPAAAIGLTNFVVRWTGSILPQYGETYTFYTTTSDGARLYVNGQLLVDKWVRQSATSWSNSITLKAQERYNLEMDFYNAVGGATAQLSWSSPSSPLAIIPQSQLFPVTNPPPSVVLSAPTNGSTCTASASVSLLADADTLFNPLTQVAFYANGAFLGAVTNPPYALTATGLSAGAYALTAVAIDGSGLSATTAPVNISVLAGTGLAYGISNRPAAPAFFNMPTTFIGALPPLLSGTGVFGDTSGMVPVSSLIPYAPNTPLWSDGALKTRYLSVPNNGGPVTPDEQISFAATGEWTFPSGSVFVKTFELLTNQDDPNSIRRLETRLLVRDTNGAVYGVTYKWRPDNSDADLLTTSQTEAIVITNSSGSFVQNWYYPSPADCLTCHTPAANFVLGLKTRQLNGSYTYPSATTDNQLRTLNHLGLLYPAIDESAIPSYTQLVSLTNTAALLVDRSRSYLDANCAQCHRPGGTGPTFDARFDTPLAQQNIINAPVLGNLGHDGAAVVVPKDVWRSVLYDRINTLDNTIKMPPLARNLIDTNAVQVLADWINSLPGTPALAPPVLAPDSGIFTNSVTLTIQPPDTNATIHFTLDGSLPTINSAIYIGPFSLDTSAVVTANAFESGFNNSVATSASYTVVPTLYSFFAPGFLANGSFQTEFWAPAGKTYIFQASPDLVNWISISTNVPAVSPFSLLDPAATNAPVRFYRVLTQ